MPATLSVSAAQPAEYLRGVGLPGSAAQPATQRQERCFCRLASYNIGWQSADRSRDPATLARLVSTICHTKSVHAFGISEVFGIEEHDLHEERQRIMNRILCELNADSAAQPAHSSNDQVACLDRPVWKGFADVHYIFVWNTTVLDLLHYEVISCGVREHPYRKAQYFQFAYRGLGGETLHLVHNQSVLSQAQALTETTQDNLWHFLAACCQ